MALDSTKASVSLTKAIAPAVCITPDGEIIDSFDNKPVTKDFPDQWASGYNQYTLDGVVTGAISDGGDETIISSYLKSGGFSPTSFGYMLADYWATVHVTPAGGFVSVSNDAVANKDLFVAAVYASMTETISKPYYKSLIDNIENIALSSVTWTAITVIGVPVTSTIA